MLAEQVFFLGREAEGPEQQREAESVIKCAEKGRVLRVARRGGQIADMRLHSTSVKQGCL